MIPALVGAAASIAGGLLSNKAAKDANKQAEANALRQEALQKEFAQSGIQWKVKDAEAAGIHPLYALGANTVSYSPTSVGTTPANFDFLGDAGQNIGRAIQSQQSGPRQLAALQLTAAQLQNEGLNLDNELKKTQLFSAARLARQPGTGPGIPDLFGPEGESPPLMHDARNPQYTPNLRAFGKDFQPSAGWSDAQSFEDRYGELSDYIMGPAILAADYWNNVYKPRQRASTARAISEGRVRNWR